MRTETEDTPLGAAVPRKEVNPLADAYNKVAHLVPDFIE